MAEITDFPIVQPTPEEVAAYEQQFGPPPLNPIRDLTAPELADLASADKENFELVSAFRANKDLWADPAVVSKVADAHNLIRQRGFSLSDLPSPRRAAGLALDVAKGFGKQLWNYGAAGVETAMGIGADLTGQEGIARELEQQAQQRVAENIAGSEQALFGLADMAGRAIQKTGRAVGIAKPLTAQTPEEKIADLWTAVGTGETQEDIGRGAGGFLTPVGGSVISELAAAGKPVRPEETAALAAGDPFSFYTFGKGFQIAGGAVPTVARQAAAQVGQRAGAVAEQAAGAGVRTLGKLTELGGRAAEITSKAAPVIAATGAAVSGQPIAALAILGGGTTAGRAVQVAGRGAAAAGKEVSEVGRQVAGRPIVSPLAQVIRDVAGALPGAAGEIITGTAADLGLAAVSAETPQQTESAVGIGTVLGAAGAAKRIAGRVISGQLIAPREYGIATPTPSSGAFPIFDRMHSAAFTSAAPGVRARLNAVRQFASGSGVNTDVFLAPDAPTLERALLDSGVDAATAKTFSEQEGFFTTSLPDASGNPRRVIVARNVEATPHEAFHAFQDVLGESANRELDALVRQEYGPQWDAEGTRYAQRLVGDLGNRAWEEVILDESGWGLDAAKEKIFREVYNMVESETGSAPPDAHVRDLADPELVRIFNEAQSRNPAARPEQFWREILSPEEAKAEADRYIARELAAENFDAVFKQRGGSLQTRPGLLQRLSRVVGNTLSTLGAEPLSGRRTEIGQIEPRFSVTERVAELAQGATPVVESATRPISTPAPPRGALPSTPEGRQQVADEARTFAEQAPEKPFAGGTRSPRELLGQIAEAIAQQAGVRINYLSAPGEPAAATTSNRTVRREIIEAFRTMPQAARSLWEKSFFPERVLKTKSGFQVMGWAPEVFASNAHKLARTLSELPNGASLTPYPLDVANKTFTDAGWQQLFADTQNFVRNQMAGQTGAGEPLVVPRELTDRGFFAPASTPARAVDLAQPQADTINMLFNFRLPDTPRVTAGKLPLNIAGQEISIATARGPQRLSVPVEPRAPFSGESAGALGIEGRSILEVNPVRSAIESAAKQAKIELPSFIEAIQKLNLENIKEVELAPELPQFRGNTLTLTAGFQPSADPRAVKSAATRDERTGQIYEGSWHGESYDFATSAGARDVDLVEGFTTNTGEFLTRDAAFNRARELNQVPEEIQQESFGRDRILESQEFDALRQFQPVAESARRLTEMTPEEWLGTVRNYKGKLGSGLTGWAWDLGASAKTFDDVQVLRQTTEILREASKIGDINQRLEIIGRAQAAREAYEAATGRNLEDTNDGSAVPGIRRMVDPNYNPPVPLSADPAASILTAHKADGGSTFNLFQNKNLAGEPVFAVSAYPERSKIIEGAPTAKDISDYIRANTELLADPKNSLGTWTNEGKTYLDVVITEPDRARAVQLGRDNNQIAIFDLQKREEIPTGGTGKPAAQFQPDRLRSQSREEPEDFDGAREEAIRIKKGLLANTKEGDEGWSEAKQLQRFGKTKEDRRFGKAVVDWVFHLRDTEALGPEPTGSFGISNNERAFLAEPGLDYVPIARRAVEGMSLSTYLRLGGHEAVTSAIEKLKAGLTSEEWAKLYQRERTLIEKFASEWSDPGIVERVRVMYEEAGAALNLRNRERYENAGLPYPGDKPFQFQPKADDAPEFKLRKPAAGGMFSKAWILPDGSPVQLGGRWHHEWLNENGEAYGIAKDTEDGSSRIEALKKGFARMNYARNGGQLTVEARAADWAKLKSSVQQFVETNIDQIDNLRVELFNDDVSAVADSGSARFMNMNSDAEKLSSIPFLESAPTGGAVSGQVSGIAQARARQFQPLVGFYSTAERVVEEKLPNRATVAQVRGVLSPQNGVKPEELKWAGLDEFLAGRDSVSKAEVVEFLRENSVKVEEVVNQNTKFEKFQLSGGENYRELLFTLPAKDNLTPLRKEISVRRKDTGRFNFEATYTTPAGKKLKGVGDTEQDAIESVMSQLKLFKFTKPSGFMSSHWDEPNVLAHARFNERTDADGNRVIFVEEIQSDWHQKGRTAGYKSEQVPAYTVTVDGEGVGSFLNRDAAERLLGLSTKSHPDSEVKIVETQVEKPDGVPDAPFKKTWHELAFKRLVRWAAENGFDRVAWTPGDVQAERYDLSKQIDSLNWFKREDGQVHITAYKNGADVLGKSVPARELSDVVGKDIAEKILSSPEKEGDLEGVDLTVGGGGMKGFYDKILVDYANKFGKKWGAKVEPVDFETKDAGGYDDVITAHTLPITSEMRRSVLDKGLAMFQPRASEQQEFGGMPAGARPFLTTSQLGSMSRKELMDHFPEAIVPKRSADSIPSKLREAPLVKDADDPVKAYSDKLTEFARSVENTPEYQMGRKWYSEFSEQLKARFGDDARVFAELLAATSPQTSVESNFKFALDALEGFKSGRFKQNIKKFEQGLQMIANEKWLSWYNRELNAGRISDPPAKPTPAAFMARWISAHDIKPRQSNGKLFGINSIPVLQVAARRWLEQNKGPKVKNFVENLLGEGTEATIDLWADRTLRRLGYADFQERWRIMPVNKQGVTDEDFAFAQSIFKNAAQQLGMKPSELQAAVWFAEKQKWASEGWSRLDLGDFREELKKTETLRKEIRGREQKKAETAELAFVEPRATR